MRIGIDIDGTLTDFEGFLKKESPKYMLKKYGLKLTNPDGYDIDQMYELEKNFINKGFSQEEAARKAKKVMAKFWDLYFIKYAFAAFRKNVRAAVKTLYYNDEVIILSSRKKTTEKTLKGRLVRNITLLGLKVNGIKADKIMFFENDQDKMEAIKQLKINLMYDDKPELLKEMTKFTNPVCISNSYNQEAVNNPLIRTIKDFKKEYVIKPINEILEKSGDKQIPENFKASKYHRLLKRLNKKKDNPDYTDKIYKRIQRFTIPIVDKKFKPIILNKENAEVKSPIIISPNHRSTIDPFFVSTSLEPTIHWMALKRFFDGDDSIFNNSKKPILCKATSLMFRAIGSIPVDRPTDNPKANNRESVNRMIKLLRDNRNLGIFPEGTTNKNPDKQYIEEGDRSGHLAFVLMREGLGTSILPISIQWIKKYPQFGNKVILNFRKPITVAEVEESASKKPNVKFSDEAYDIWKERIVSGLIENEQVVQEMLDCYDQQKTTAKQKVYYKQNKPYMR
ncbi:MAG TPA: hypothetical protein GX708_04850 [Gallicola sp.]|nr:hypothetical protein [Gallicola sp.]